MSASTLDNTPKLRPILTGALGLLERVVAATAVGLPGEALAALDYVRRELESNRETILDLQREAREAARDAAAEAAWKERQGEDYGSY